MEMLLEFAACSHPSARIQQADKSTSGTGGCRAPLTHSFLRRGFFCAVGTAARAGEAGADPPYPPAQECSALHASHSFPSWMQLHGCSWETHGVGAILCSPQAVTLLMSHQMLLEQPRSKENNNSQSGLALGQQCLSTEGKPSSGAPERWGSLWQVAPN